LGQDEVFAADGDPIPAYSDLLDGAADILEANAGLSTMRDSFTNGRVPYEPLDVTANHYGRLWGGFSPERYFNEAELLLRARLERNGIDTSWFEGKRALDCGCGGGRYTVALKRLGFAEVVGCDWSDEALSVARARASEANITGVSYRKTDVLALPFADDEFDFVFSNGVFHHTYNTEQGVGELIRVMQPEGRGWLYLYARPGGLDRLTHYLARLLLKNADHEVCRNYCRALGMDGNRIFFLLDLWLTPIAECYTPAEVEEMLDRAGCRARQRLTRGSDLDLVEQIQDGTAHAAVKFGVGENRYFFFGKSS
jgi:SAM-dependent methyltransferase